MLGRQWLYVHMQAAPTARRPPLPPQLSGQGSLAVRVATKKTTHSQNMPPCHAAGSVFGRGPRWKNCLGLCGIRLLGRTSKHQCFFLLAFNLARHGSRAYGSRFSGPNHVGFGRMVSGMAGSSAGLGNFCACQTATDEQGQDQSQGLTSPHHEPLLCTWLARKAFSRPTALQGPV